MFILPISPIGVASEQKISAVAGNANASLPFSDILSDSIKNLQEAQSVSKQDAYDLAMGNTDNLHNIAIHSAESSAALTLTVQLASRAVGAYREMMQMQV